MLPNQRGYNFEINISFSCLGLCAAHVIFSCPTKSGRRSVLFCYYLRSPETSRSEIKDKSSKAQTREREREREREGQMKERELDYVLVPLGMGVLGSYHVWLLFTILRNPRKTVIGLNAESRHQWVFSMMADPLKNGVLAVQTIRNNIMASTLLATTAITLSSLISVYASNKSSSNTSMELLYGNKTPIVSSVKYFAILLCFLVAFLCNVQCIRYYAHVSFLATLPAYKDNRVSIEYVARNLNRGSYFWSLGLRAFYLSFPLFLWVFGPIPMFLCSCIMSFLLYFLDTTTSFTRDLYSRSVKEEAKVDDVESVCRTSTNVQYEDIDHDRPLLTSNG